MSAISRRRFFKYGIAAGGGLLFFRQSGVGQALASHYPAPLCPATDLLPGGSILKFKAPLVIPPAMPRTAEINQCYGPTIDYYEIAVRQFKQQILPPGMPETTVWSYGSVNHPETFNYPAFTIESRWRKPVRVKWINDLKDDCGHFLPHLLPVDPTLHWANPPGGVEGRDSRPTFTSTPGPYTGPVPLVTHLHGGERTPQESDGFPEAWFLPDANDIPAGFAATGTFYDYFKDRSPLGDQWEPGAAVFQYPNNQRATALWYHDHTLGLTRVNVYAGPAGFYLLRGGPADLEPGILPGPAPQRGDPPGKKYFEIPLAIQDRSFRCDGSLFYPDTRELFDGFPGPYIPDSPVPPIWNPEFFGDTMVVNGRTWPFLKVEQRRYRFRILDGCDARFLILKFDNDLPFWLIGTDGGFLPEPVKLTQLLLSPAQRADVIVDFTHVPHGTSLILQNLGPDGPFAGLGQNVPADPTTTGVVMQFHVVPATSKDRSTPPHKLVLPPFNPLGHACFTRQVSLNEEMFNPNTPEFPSPIPIANLLGTVGTDTDGFPTGEPLMWDNAITENPQVGATEIWEIYNFTVDAHPIHIHELQFQLVNREDIPTADQPVPPPPTPPTAQESGFIDTVIALPGQITRVKATFSTPGLFVWHCHIIEHEDNEMMRPYFIGDIPDDLPL